VHTHTHARTCTHTHTNAQSHTRTHTRTHANTQACTHTQHKHTRPHICFHEQASQRTANLSHAQLGSAKGESNGGGGKEKEGGVYDKGGGANGTGAEGSSGNSSDDAPGDHNGQEVGRKACVWTHVRNRVHAQVCACAHVFVFVWEL
jgi:hypothetical protein